MSTSLRDALRLLSEDDVPFEELAAEVARTDPGEALREVRRAEGLGWVTPEEAKTLLRAARQ